MLVNELRLIARSRPCVRTTLSTVARLVLILFQCSVTIEILARLDIVTHVTQNIIQHTPGHSLQRTSLRPRGESGARVHMTSPLCVGKRVRERGLRGVSCCDGIFGP